MAIDIREINKGSSRNVSGGTKWIKWAVAGAAALIVAFNSFTIVPAGHTGVVLTMGEVSKTSYDAGFHLKAPFVQKVEPVSNKIQVYETPASAVSKDLQTVSSNIAVNYRLVAASTPKMYEEVGTDYKTVLIAPVVQECMKSATAKYTAEQLITERQAVGDEVKAALDLKLNDYGIFIEKFNIVNFDFSEEFNSAIEAKQVAEQNLLKTETEQKLVRVIAQTDADKKVIAAKAEAEAILAEAQAQADANKLLEESLTDKVIAYNQIQRWNGVMPKVTSGNSNGLLINVPLEDTPAATQPSGSTEGN